MEWNETPYENLTDGPHAAARIYVAGPPPEAAAVTLILVHGRGAGAGGIAGLGEAVHTAHPDLALRVVVPDAVNATWYPQRFIMPEERNEPWLGSARSLVRTLVERESEAIGGRERVVLAGFSQGACLASDTGAALGGRFGALGLFSGGRIGPFGTVFHTVPMEQTPVLMACSDHDPHIPVERVHETADAFAAASAEVDLRIYEGYDHRVRDEDLASFVELVRAAAR